MLLRKHQFVALVAGSLSVLALVNCSDNDTAPGGANGGSDAGKAGASQPGAGSSAGGKAGATSHAGASSHAGEPSETGGDTSEAGGAGKPSSSPGAWARGGAVKCRYRAVVCKSRCPSSRWMVSRSTPAPSECVA